MYDPFVSFCFFLVLIVFIIVVTRIPSQKEKSILKKTINSGSRDPKTYYENEKNKRTIGFLMVLFAVVILYLIIINLSK
jgi:hypothetical protein